MKSRFRTATLLGASLGAVFLLSSPAQALDEAAAKALAKKNDCFKCHAIDKSKKGPSLKKISEKFQGKADAEEKIITNITTGPRVKLLDDLGLSAAAAWYVNQFSNRTGLATRLDLPEENPVLGGAVATALFRILQESLTNIARHAQASTIDITLTRDSTEWTLSIADDGKGFVYDPSRRGSLGLIGMRERAQVLGGRFSIASSPGKGTVIQAAIPIEHGEGSDEVK